MIFDKLNNAHLYFPLGERLTKALQYLKETDFTNLEAGKYEIDGENIFAVVSEYNTKPLSAGKWEAHKKYIDIQYIVSGKEKLGFTESEKVIVMEEYNEDSDYTIYKGDGNFLIADEKYFAIFFPTDIHMPGMAINIPKQVKKVVLKVRTDYVGKSAVPETETNQTPEQSTEPEITNI